MPDSHSTSSADPGKPTRPSKPSPDFPLFAHAAGVWAKKIRGKLVYFGPWDDPDAALAKYNEQKDALHAGRKPREDTEGLTVKELANRFLNCKRDKVQSGEMAERSWQDYKTTCDLIVGQFGKSRLVADLGPDDFAALRKKMAQHWGPVRLGNTIQYVRSVCKYGLDNGLIDRPVCVGQGFARPTKKVLRLNRAEKGAKLFTADQIRQLIDAAGIPLRAMVLLGINAGLGNADVGRLPLT